MSDEPYFARPAEHAAPPSERELAEVEEWVRTRGQKELAEAEELVDGSTFDQRVANAERLDAPMQRLLGPSPGLSPRERVLLWVNIWLLWICILMLLWIYLR